MPVITDLFSIQVEFSRGLVVLVVEKLMNDIGELMYDDDLFSNMVNQALAFDRELRTVYDYPEAQLSCLHVLSQPQPFKKWITIERKGRLVVPVGN